MALRLITYLSILILGGVIGYSNRISPNLSDKLEFIQNLCLFFLLFVMGTKIGADDKVIQSFFSIGYKALILASFTMIFSILFVRIIGKFVTKKEGEGKVEL